MTLAASAALERAFGEHRGFLWGLCYRLLGDAADAEDVVQSTFVRALERPPRRLDDPLRPWLVRVALNLGRDHLRRRRRRGYDGDWLPSPIETGDQVSPPSYEPVATDTHPGARYELLESVSFGFLIALEALSPAQRAVLLLRDVFDYSVREAAEALEMSEANVRTTHLRARRRMRGYEASRRVPTRDEQESTRQSLAKFLGLLQAGDAPGVEAMLASDVRAVNDAGGEFHAARLPIVGPIKVARLYMGLVGKGPPPRSAELAMLNGLPALVADLGDSPPGYAKRLTLHVRVDDEGHIVELLSVLASRKLAGLTGRARWDQLGEDDSNALARRD